MFRSQVINIYHPPLPVSFYIIYSLPLDLPPRPSTKILVSEAIGVDDQYLDECYENLKSAPTTDDKIKWRNMLLWHLARHAISEELTVYPSME